MSKHEDNPDMNILKTATCKSISAKSTLTYQVGSDPDGTIHVRITKNTGGGFFSDEWISMKDIQSVMEKRPKGAPVTSLVLFQLYKGKSVNSPAFLCASMAAEKLLYPMKGKKRSLEPAEDFTEKVSKFKASKASTRKASTSSKKKTTTKKTVSRKAAIKKKALSRKKTASSLRGS